MTETEWIDTAADLLISRGGVPADKAHAVAADIFINTLAFFKGNESDALGSSPEEAVDSEMSYWDAD